MFDDKRDKVSTLLSYLRRLVDSAVITLDVDDRVVLKQGPGVVDDGVRHVGSSALD